MVDAAGLGLSRNGIYRHSRRHLGHAEDMYMALIGALCALLFMAGWQNRQLRRLPSRP